MKKCPSCRTELARAEYEGVAVEVCPACGGHLVLARRLDGIKRNPATPAEQLKSEAERFSGSVRRLVTCPACSDTMEKTLTRSPITIELDVCPACSAVWLDPGELEIVQLAYEVSAKAKNDRALKERVRALDADPARKARFEQNLAKLPEGLDTPLDAIGEGLSTALWDDPGGVWGSGFRGVLKSIIRGWRR